MTPADALQVLGGAFFAGAVTKLLVSYLRVNR